jgi:hypothetical protein
VRWWLLLLCGCNQVFSLSETVSTDAQYFDSPSRQPPHCPDIGKDLAFSPQLHQLHEYCIDYDVSATANLAIASCIDANMFRVFSGPADGPLAPVPELPTSAAEYDVTGPEIDPDGTILMLSTYDVATNVGELRVYHRDGTVWIRDANVPNPPAAASNPSRGPAYRILGTGGATDVSELAYIDGTWQSVRTHSLQALGVPSVGRIWLSADALRILFMADAFSSYENRYMAYADRASVDDAFGRARPLPVPVVFDAYVTEDCGRLYFSGLHSIFYAESP